MSEGLLEEEDEGYFASMTDIMVGLLFIFIIVIMFFALQINDADQNVVPRAEYERVSQRVAELETRLADLKAQLAAQERLMTDLRKTEAEQIAEIDRLKAENARLRQEIEDLERKLNAARQDSLSAYLTAAENQRRLILRSIEAAMAEAGFENIEVVEEQGIVRLPNDVLFASARSTLPDQGTGARAVAQLGRALERVLPCYTRGPRSDDARDRSCNPTAAFVETVFVEGHTDIKPLRTVVEPGVTDNLALSARRAANIFRRLRARNPAVMEFKSVGQEPVLNVAAYGETRPIPGVSDIARNRRIDLRILMHTPTSESLSAVQALVTGARERP